MDKKRQKKCEVCKLRLRSKTRRMHRQCERDYYDPPKPKPVARPAIKYPPPRFCPPCHSLDNGLYPAEFCRLCGAPTIEQLPIESRTTKKPKRARPASAPRIVEKPPVPMIAAAPEPIPVAVMSGPLMALSLPLVIPPRTPRRRCLDCDKPEIVAQSRCNACYLKLKRQRAKRRKQNLHAPLTIFDL